MLSLIFTLLVLALIIWALAWYFTGREEGPLKTGIDIEKNESQSNDQKTNLQLKENELKSSRRKRMRERESKNKKDRLKDEEENLKGTESEIGLEEDGEESNEPQLKERNKEQPRFEMKKEKEPPRFEMKNKKEPPRFELQEDEDK